MSESSVFIVDGIEMQSEMSSQVHWKDRNFFEVIYKGKKFHGEILKRDIENRRLSVKLNHRVFDIQKKFVLDDLSRPVTHNLNPFLSFGEYTSNPNTFSKLVFISCFPDGFPEIPPLSKP